VVPPGQEDPNAVKTPDPVEQADGKVTQAVSWDVAEDFNLARARAKERREQRMAQQQALAAKAQAEAEAKVKAAWEQNAHKNGLPQAKEPSSASSTVVHLVRKPRPRVKKHANHTLNRTNHTDGIKNVSNTSMAEKPDPALDGLDHMAEKVANFGEALEKFSRAQKGKGKKAQKLPPQVQKIMENAEALMKKIIAVADDKSMDVPALNATKESVAVENKSSTSHGRVVTNTTSSRANLTASKTAPTANDTMALKEATNAKNKTLVVPSNTSTALPSNKTDVVPRNGSVATLADANNGTQASNASRNGTLKVSSNATVVATMLNQSATRAGNSSFANKSGVKPSANASSSIGNQTGYKNGTMKVKAMLNATESTPHTEKQRFAATHYNKPDRLVHSALGSARLAAAKLRGMRAHLHKPAQVDDSWKLANAEIDSRIVGLKAAKDEALQADDHDLADSLQEKIKGLQAEAAENEAKAKKVKGQRHSIKSR
jgi:hypothetical protein